MSQYNQDGYNEFNNIASHAGKTAVRYGAKLLNKGIKVLAKGIGKVLLSLLKATGPYILILVILPIIVYAIYSMVSETTLDNFVSNLGRNATNTDTESLMSYIDSLEPIEYERYLAEYDINLKILEQYMELENETVEEDEESTVKLETKTKVITDGRTTKNQTTTKNSSNMTLEKSQSSYPYRLYWQLLAGFDIYMNVSHMSEEYTWERTIPNNAKKYLIPEYKWTREGKYTREVTNKSETIVIRKRDGMVTSETETIVEDKYIYPLPYLEEVKTAFGTYIFDYTEKITTTEHEWGDYIVNTGPVVHHRSSKPIGYHKKTDPETGNLVDDKSRPIYDTWTTQTITKKRYSKTYQVDENLLKGEPEFVIDIEPFTNFILESNIEISELANIYKTISKLPNSYECIEALSIALNEYGILEDIDGIPLHIARPINLDITLPSVAGNYSRNDIVNTAKSLLGVPYFWGGKHNKIGINPEWGTLKTVTASGSWSTGTAIPYGLDCSGFISWAYNQMLLPDGQKFPDGTKNQYVSTLLIPISESQLQPGDIGYTKGIDHVGMYVGNIDDLQVFIHAGGRLYSSELKPAGQIILSYNNTSAYYEGNAPTKFIHFFRLKYRYKGE